MVDVSVHFIIKTAIRGVTDPQTLQKSASEILRFHQPGHPKLSEGVKTITLTQKLGDQLPPRLVNRLAPIAQEALQKFPILAEVETRLGLTPPETTSSVSSGTAEERAYIDAVLKLIDAYKSQSAS